jgi:hypothetical protein
MVFMSMIELDSVVAAGRVRRFELNPRIQPSFDLKKVFVVDPCSLMSKCRCMSVPGVFVRTACPLTLAILNETPCW